MMNKKQAAIEFRKALQYFAGTLTTEDKLMAIPSVFPVYKAGTAYVTGDVFSYGINSVGDPQLYQVLQNHRASGEWPPDEVPSLYKAIGIINGIAVWVQPLGATDAYCSGDKVSHGGIIWSSTLDNNVWEPGVYGWVVAP